MIDAGGDVLYVGKAKNLKNRVTSYFRRQFDTKTIQLVKQIASIEITVTRSEREALLLEHSLIQKLLPRYNVIFKDDKSYPYLKIETQHPYPRVGFHRGAKTAGARYFGPYPNTRSVRETIDLLQKLFKIRPCEDTFFKGRSRPCLQYQIKRCTGPCTQLISPEDYARDLGNAVLLIEGKNDAVLAALAQEMTKSAEREDFEQAARFRDQMTMLREVQRQQIIQSGLQDLDVVGIANLSHKVCVHVLYIRQGRISGSRQYFPSQASLDDDAENLLESFLLQHYLKAVLPLGTPEEILLSAPLTSSDTLEALLNESINGSRRLKIACNVRGDRARWVEMASQSAERALKAKMVKGELQRLRFDHLQQALGLSVRPERIECFDVSHTQGEATIAACVAFNEEGPYKAAYRRYNIKGPFAPGDDYAAMTESLTRHFKRLLKEDKSLPDILLIDGGKGQLSRAEQVKDALSLTQVTLIGVAKGTGRKAGLETLFLSSKGRVLDLDMTDEAFRLILQVRDEAHRFAITAHRNKRSKKRLSSPLEEIPGVGDERRRALLSRLGGYNDIKRASLEEIAAVPGISKTLATRIYAALHGQ